MRIIWFFSKAVFFSILFFGLGFISMVAITDRKSPDRYFVMTETEDIEIIEIYLDPKIKDSSLEDFVNRLIDILNELLAKDQLALPKTGPFKISIFKQKEMIIVRFEDGVTQANISQESIDNLQTPQNRKKFAKRAASKLYLYLLEYLKDQKIIEIDVEPRENIEIVYYHQRTTHLWCFF